MGNSSNKDVDVSSKKIVIKPTIVIKPPEENKKQKIESSAPSTNDDTIIISNLDNVTKIKQTDKKCMNCNCNLSNVYFIKLPKCHHIFCTECLGSHIEKFLAPKVKCVLNECSSIISDRIIRQCLSEPRIEDYENLCQNSVGVKCAIKECVYFYKPESEEGLFECPHCEQPNCMSCHYAHLFDQPCGESPDQNKFQEKGLEKLNKRRVERLREIERNSTIYLNPVYSTCEICETFLLPRQGILLRKCMHNCCIDCLKNHLRSKGNVLLWQCPQCNICLEDPECRELLGHDLADRYALMLVENKFFNCQTPDCYGLWDPGDFTGVYNCPRCKKNNCISCKAIHEGKTCAEYKKSKEYKNLQQDKKALKGLECVVCYNCNEEIHIKKGGCGAIKCPKCLHQVCQFTGLKVGPDGCKCTAAKPCHTNCKRGCYPE